MNQEQYLVSVACDGGHLPLATFGTVAEALNYSGSSEIKTDSATAAKLFGLPYPVFGEVSIVHFKQGKLFRLEFLTELPD